jgi:proteic killer suppression protein
MIVSFADKKAERLFRAGDCPLAWRSFERIARRKLDILDYAQQLGDLRSPPGNRLDALKGDRKGQWSIRINDQWRICFVWSEQGPRDVEIVDYH